MEIRLWKDRENGLIEPTLFSEKAEELALVMKADNKMKKGKVNKRTQFRKFYDEVLRLNLLAKERPGQWESIKPQVHMLTAKAAYAEGRELISTNFRTFIKDSVAQVETSADLNIFSNFFEAFMGFYRLHGPNN